MIKQYTVEKAYTGNVRVKKYIDGKCIHETIINDYDLLGYQMAIENDGFEQAIDADKAREDMERAKEAYEDAVERYEYAKKHALAKWSGNR